MDEGEFGMREWVERMGLRERGDGEEKEEEGEEEEEEEEIHSHYGDTNQKADSVVKDEYLI